MESVLNPGTITVPIDGNPTDTMQDPTLGGATLLRVGGAAEPIPAWLAGADQEEAEELAQLGIVSQPVITQEAERDALVSDNLRALATYAAELQRFRDAEQREHDAIKSRYQRLAVGTQRQWDRIASYILYLARGAIFVKGKSRKVGWGVYGVSKDRDGIVVTDNTLATDWLAEHRPDLVMIDLSVSVQQARAFLANAIVPDFARDDAVALAVKAALEAKDFGYNKTALKTLVLGTKATKAAPGHEGVDVPGVDRVYGADQPFYEIAPPYDLLSVPVQSSMLFKTGAAE